MASLLKLPPSLQELILAKLPLQDLLRSQAVCKLWRRLSTTNRFRKRYEWLAAKPWLLILKLTESIVTTDTSGKQMPLPSCMIYADSQVVSTSAGLLLLMFQKTRRFAVLNPITMDAKHLPALDVAAGRLVYSGIFCPDASSYRVVVIGLMEADELTGHLYSLPNEVSKYMQPFMRVYSSSSEEWTSMTDFPPGFLLPFRDDWDFHQSFISKGVFYCTIFNTDDEDKVRKIARFNMVTLQWNPRLVELPEQLSLTSFIEDEGGELVVVMSDRENRRFVTASIESDNVVIKSRERLFPEKIHPTILSFTMLQAFGVLGKVLCLHVPLEANGVDSIANWGNSDTVQLFGDIEPRVHSCLFDMEAKELLLFDDSILVPLSMVFTGKLQYVKLVFYPSLRLP